MIVIMQGINHSDKCWPIAVASSERKAIKWLREQGYKQEKQPYGNVLYVFADYWCDLEDDVIHIK